MTPSLPIAESWSGRVVETPETKCVIEYAWMNARTLANTNTDITSAKSVRPGRRQAQRRHRRASERSRPLGGAGRATG